MHNGAFLHSLSSSLAQTIGFLVMYFKVFIKIFEFQMYVQGHTLYHLLVDVRCYGLVRRAFPRE